MRLSAVEDGNGRFLWQASNQRHISVSWLVGDFGNHKYKHKTMNFQQPTAQAVAITNSRITKVGTNQEIEPLIGENTMVLNLGGKTVLPAIDTHIHVADYGRCLMWLDLTHTKSIIEMQPVKEKAKQTSAGKWIIGQGWNETRFQEARMPNVADLDEAAPDNPVILYREAAMVCAVNTKALQEAGITRRQPCPMGATSTRIPMEV